MLDSQLHKNLVVVEAFEDYVGLSLNGINPSPTEFIETDNLTQAFNLKSALLNQRNNVELDSEKIGKNLVDEKIGNFTLEDENGFRSVEIWSMGDDGLVLYVIGDDGEKAVLGL